MEISDRTERQILREIDKCHIVSLAEESGVHQSTIYFWLQGKHRPSLQNLEKICIALGYTINITVKRVK